MDFNRFKETGIAKRFLLRISFFIGISFLPALNTYAQNFSEWFRQGSTQKKYLLQQIAALEVYSKFLKQGYQIAHGGLGNISGYLNMESVLHGTYYTRMEVASASVKYNYQVKEILDWQKDILNVFSGVRSIPGLSDDEIQYLLNVKAAVLKDCDQQMNLLNYVVSDGKVKMSDAERLALLSNIHKEMLNNYRFAAGFTAQAKIYGQQRLKEKQESQTGQKIYGLN